MPFRQYNGKLRVISPAISLSLMMGVILFTGIRPVFGQIPNHSWHSSDNQRGVLNNYNDYSFQAQEAYTQGQLTKAIELYRKALPLAPDISQATIYNNLAAVYMKRGNFYMTGRKQPEAGLSDFRNAYYYIEYGWPEGLERKPLYEKNLKVAKENLAICYANLKINPADTTTHSAMAKKLWSEAKFEEAVVEFAQINERSPKDKEALKALGNLFNVLNRPDKSKKYLQKLVALDGSSISDEDLSMLANAQNKSGQVQDAVSTLNKALEMNPGNVSALNQLETIWRDELKFNPSNPTAHANLAWVLQKKKRFDDAISQYNMADYLANRDPNTTFDVKKLIRLNLGSLYQEMRRYDKAIEAYNTVLQAEPGNISASYDKATVLRDMGRRDEAIQTYYRILSNSSSKQSDQQVIQNARRDLVALLIQHPDSTKVTSGLKFYANRFENDPLVQSQVGEEFHKLKNYDEAANYYQRAIRLNPNLASVYANLGAALQAEGKEDEALDAFKKAQSLDPKNAAVSQYLGTVKENAGIKQFQQALSLQQQGKHAEAIPYFQKALAINPNNTDLIAAYGVSLQNTGKLPDAIAQYQKAIAAAPENGTYHFYLGTAYHQQQALGKAKAEYEKTLTLEKQNQDIIKQAKDALAGFGEVETQTLLTDALDAYNKKQFPKALSLIQQTLNASPQNATAYYYKALVLSEQNKTSEAVHSYELALKYNPEFKDAYYGLGVAQDEQKNMAAAKTAFQKFLDLSKGSDDDFVKYAKQRVGKLNPEIRTKQ